MDEMVAKFRLDNLADRIYFEVERGLVKGWHHGASTERAQIATLPRGRAVGKFFGQVDKLSASLQLGF